MRKLILAGFVLLILSAMPAMPQTGAQGLGFPTPPDATLSQEVDLDPARLMEIIRAGNPKLEQFIREIRKCHLVSYQLHGDSSLSDLLKFYDSPLQMQGWHSIIREEKPGRATAIFDRPSGGLLIMSLDQKDDELAMVRVEGTFDFETIRNSSSSGTGSNNNTVTNTNSTSIQPFHFEQVPIGNPDWTEDAAAKIVTGVRSYRQAIIPVSGSGKLVLEGFADQPEVTRWSRSEIVLDYRKTFTGPNKDSALDMERKNLLVVDVSSGAVSVTQALVAPATEATTRTSLKVSVPNAWKTEIIQKK